MASRERKNHPCPNPHCGSTFYTVDYEYVGEGEQRRFARVWRCVNCTHVEEIKSHPRRTNKRIALDNYRRVKETWKEIDAALDRLTSEQNPNRIPNGCHLVHSSTFNHHLDQLLSLGRPTTWEVKYHTKEAENEREKARNFVAEHGGFDLKG